MTGLARREFVADDDRFGVGHLPGDDRLHELELHGGGADVGRAALGGEAHVADAAELGVHVGEVHELRVQVLRLRLAEHHRTGAIVEFVRERDA